MGIKAQLNKNLNGEIRIEEDSRNGDIAVMEMVEYGGPLQKRPVAHLETLEVTLEVVNSQKGLIIMKEIKAQVTLLCSGERVILEINDKNSGITFVLIEMSPKQFMAALGGLANVNVDKCIVRGLENVGKKREWKTIEFKLGKGVGYGNERKELAEKEAIKNCPKGWSVGLYFDSQDSFFYKDDVTYARCNIERYVK